MRRVSLAARVTLGAAFLLAGCAPLLTGCAPRSMPSNVWGSLAERRPPARERVSSPISQDEWTLARSRLDRLRAGLPTAPWVERVRVAMMEPRTGRRYEARGALAVDPSRAVRMLLLGPGGATAIDLWVTPDKFRFSVPQMKIETRGGARPEEARGLPVAFFRWWFLAPASGRLLTARSSPSESAWILRDGDATVVMRSDGARFVALRRDAGHLEGIEWVGRNLAQSTGARGRYVEDRFGLRVEVLVEELLPDPPDPSAFVDPDAAEPAESAEPEATPKDAIEPAAGGGTSL